MMMMNHDDTATTTTVPQITLLRDEAAPVRCFLNDIPSIITQHNQKHLQQQSFLFDARSMDVTTTSTSTSTTVVSSPYTDDINTNTTFHHDSYGSNDEHINRKRRKIEMIPPSTLWLRLLGTVVNESYVPCDGEDNASLRTMTDENNMDISSTTEQQQQQLYNHTVTIDDGTGSTVLVYVTIAMIQKISIKTGMILDCIVRVEQQSHPTSNVDYDTTTILPTNQHSSLENIRFIADQLVVQDSSIETLRWLELSHQAASNHSCTNTNTDPVEHHVGDGNDTMNDGADDDDQNNSNNNDPSSFVSFSPPDDEISSIPKPVVYHTQQSSQWMGYPTRDLSSEDIYRIIASECEFASYQTHHPSATAASSSRTTTTTTIPQNNGGAGVSLQDLADCFDYSIAYVGTLVQELQNSGQIYQNENGLYTLL